MTPTRGRRVATEVLWVVVLLAIGGMLFALRADGPARMATGDTYWYMRQAQIFAGVDPAAASARAADELCRDINRASVAAGGTGSCDRYEVTTAPRYAAIFHSRPGFPLVAAPFVAVLGPWHGMVAVTLMLALAAVVLAYLAVWLATGLRGAGLVAGVALLLLPSGHWLTRLLAEGATTAGCLAALIGVTLAWRGRRSGAYLLAVALAWLFAVRSASGMATALAVVAASVAFLPRHGARATATVAAGALASWAALSAVLGLPGLNETIQDYATQHFRLPDVADPMAWLAAKNKVFWAGRLREAAASPGMVIAVAAASAVLVVRLRRLAVPWILLGLSGFALVVAHPVPSQLDRLLLPLWIPVAAALGCASVLLLRKPHPQPTPAAPPETPAPSPQSGSPAGHPAAQ